MTLFSKRLPHVVTRADLALLLAPTVAASARVEFDIAHERMERAVASHRVVEALYEGLSAGLQELQGPRTSEDMLIDKLSDGVQKRRSRVKAANVTPAVSAALVFLDLEIGQAPEMMKNVLESEKGKKLLREGLQQLGAHLLRELIR